jgi:hypothetical protein
MSTLRRLVPGTRRTTGGAMRNRKTKRPSAIITPRNITQRATSKRVVVAVPAIFGIVNCA